MSTSIDREAGHRSGAIAVTIVVLLALVTACSNGDAPNASAGDGTSPADPPSTAPVTAPMGERFTGPVEAFYEVPDPLPPAPPGTVIRTMAIDASPGQVGLRIMYHSTDAEGDDRAVTGTVRYPTGAAPTDGWPVLAWAHGTTGLAPACAPSRKPGPPPAFGVQGVHVATDYIGLGPVGELHPYLSAAAEGHAVIDGVAAARSLPELHAGDEWVVAGVSQGGHAALVTNEQAAERLPAMRLLGAVAIAPGSQLGETFGDDLQARIITTMVMVGVAAEDRSVQLEDYLSPEARPAAATIATSCMQDIIATAVPRAASPDYFLVDPRTAPVGQAWLEANDPGQVRAESPLLLVQGGQDVVVLPARTDSLFARLCRVGQVVERVDLPAGTHDSVTGLADAEITAWIAARFAGNPPTNRC